MSDEPLTREDIQRRRKAIAESVAHYRREFNRGTITTSTALAYVQAECEHLEIRSNYEISHFVRECRDCGKQL
jgi:hypothetical protein